MSPHGPYCKRHTKISQCHSHCWASASLWQTLPPTCPMHRPAAAPQQTMHAPARTSMQAPHSGLRPPASPVRSNSKHSQLQHSWRRRTNERRRGPPGSTPVTTSRHTSTPAHAIKRSTAAYGCYSRRRRRRGRVRTCSGHCSCCCGQCVSHSGARTLPAVPGPLPHSVPAWPR